MCRSIQTLYNVEPPATEDEIRAAARQYVRKLSGYRAPSKANEAAFEAAVEAVAAASRELLARLETHAPARDRELMAVKRAERGRRDFARGRESI